MRCHRSHAVVLFRVGPRTSRGARTHFFVANAINRFSVGTKNKDLKVAADGSLTIYVQTDAPTDPTQHANWHRRQRAGDFSLYVRAYWPKEAVTDGSWTPPPVHQVKSLCSLVLSSHASTFSANVALMLRPIRSSARFVQQQ